MGDEIFFAGVREVSLGRGNVLTHPGRSKRRKWGGILMFSLAFVGGKAVNRGMGREELTEGGAN